MFVWEVSAFLHDLTGKLGEICFLNIPTLIAMGPFSNKTKPYSQVMQRSPTCGTTRSPGGFSNELWYSGTWPGMAKRVSRVEKI